jgi:hypothetical protein
VRDESDHKLMSATVHFKCNSCGAEISQAQAAEFCGIWQGQTTVASGGEHAWHACSFDCAAKHLRQVANGVEARGRELAEKRAKHAADQARQASVQADALTHAAAETAARAAHARAVKESTEAQAAVAQLAADVARVTASGTRVPPKV